MEKCFEKAESKNSLAYIDGDTVVMIKTREAALRAAGSVVSAIDEIYTSKSSR